ncbi:MAG: RNA polymerase sigma factor [Clostridiaceae bacterium]|nr:RNA polymerase sigma factor [Clostridiaceae bacterium]
MKREQLGQLILASEDSMYHVAKSLLYNDADCQDAIQETIAKAFDKIGTLKQDTYAKTWLIRILINECYGIMRKEKKIISLETCEQEEPWMERQDYSDLYEALMRLTEEARLAVTLYYMEGYSIREIARMTRVTESAVKNRKDRKIHRPPSDDRCAGSNSGTGNHRICRCFISNEE